MGTQLRGGCNLRSSGLRQPERLENCRCGGGVRPVSQRIQMSDQAHRQKVLLIVEWEWSEATVKRWSIRHLMAETEQGDLQRGRRQRTDQEQHLRNESATTMIGLCNFLATLASLSAVRLMTGYRVRLSWSWVRGFICLLEWRDAYRKPRSVDG